MSDLLLYYQRPEPATWVFLSSFLLLGVYFVFHRFLSIRNLDLLLLILLAPGLMMVYEGRRMQMNQHETVVAERLAHNQSMLSQHGRMAGEGEVSVQVGMVSADEAERVAARIDQPARPTSFFIQTPILEPGPQGGRGSDELRSDVLAPLGATNAQSGYPATEPAKWSAESLEYSGFVALLIACLLLMIRMLIDPALVRRPLLMPNLTIGGLSFIGISLFMFLMSNIITSTPREQQMRSPELGPGYALLNMLPQLPTTPDSVDERVFGTDEEDDGLFLGNVARVLAILSNFAIVFGIVGVGYWHFDNIKTGIGCAVMYLLLPYTAQMTGNLEHVMPAALLVLALLSYRQPLISGVFFGLAAGLVYYPLFILPLWLSFYWKRGGWRLIIGVIASLVVLSGLLLLQGWEAFGEHLSVMFGLWYPRMQGLAGVWAPGRVAADFRLPVLVAFILLSGSFAIWPSRKNLGTLMCGTAVVMLAAQFWHGNGGGLYMAWFLPFVLLTVFRPNLDDRVASSVVQEWPVRLSARLRTGLRRTRPTKA